MGERPIAIETRPGSPVDGRLLYRPADHAFDFKVADARTDVHSVQGTASLLVGTIQVAVDPNTGRLLFAWGYSPVQGWRRSAIIPLPQERGRALMDASDLLPGVGISIVEARDVLSLVDPSRKAVQVSNGVEPELAFIIAPGVTLLLSGSRLVGVRLSPDNFEELSLAGSNRSVEQRQGS